MLVAALMFAAASSYGQIGTSTMTGRVTDTTGAVVPNVAITIVHLATNFVAKTTTNDEGLYRALSLQPGTYRVTAEVQGFKKAVRENIELRTGDTLAVDISMQVGNVSESIEVQGGATLLETETSATGTVVSGTVLYDLPLYQRFINSTMNIVPGMTTGGYAYGGGLGAYHLAGQRAGAIGIFEDGVNGNDQNAGTETTKPIQNSIAEVKVLTTVPPAEYGHSAGGVISAVKKTGTNEYHGLASFYGRTRRMQHRLFFDRLRTSQPSPGRPNGVPTFFMMPDANFSGPVNIPKVYNGKNKTFFFFGFQRLHEKKVAQVDSSVPSLAMRQGDFSNPALNRIYDPATTRNTGGVWARDIFPGNVIPASRIDPVARKVLEFDPWRQPNRAGGFTSTGATGNYLADEFARVFLDDYNLRLDHQFNPNFKIYYSWTDNRYSGFQRPWNMRDERPDFDHVAGNYSPSRNQLMSFGKTWIISPSLVNDARVGYTRRFNKLVVTNYGKNWPQQLGIPNISPDLMPAFGSGDRNNPSSIYGLSGATPNYNANETVSFRDDLSYIRGKHAFKMGYDLLRFRLNSAILANPVRYDFGGSTTGLSPQGVALGGTDAGSPFAGFLTGYVTSATVTSELTSWLPRSSIHSFYFQDDWKVTPTLTVNAGIRYSNESPFTTKYWLMSQFDPSGTDALTGRTGSITHPTKGLNRRDNNNFNPRIGLAWHPREKWVFRGGLGFYTVDVKFPAGREMYDEYQAIALQQAAPGDPTPIYQISRATAPPAARIVNGVAPFVGTNFGGRNINYWDPNLRNPYATNWNASVQYELARDYLVDVSYQGSNGVGLVERWELNTMPFSDASTSLLRTNLAAAQNFRPYSHLGNITMRSNFGHSSFHSGTVKLEKRMSRGLYFSTFYTLSKAINSSDTDNSGGGVLPIQNRKLEKGRAGYDRNHRYIGTINWELPLGKGKRFSFGNGVGGWLMSGWELSWIQTAESGNPLNFSWANAPTNNYYPGFAGARRPNLVGTPVFNFSRWNNGGGDRFVEVNRPAVIDINAFAYPGEFQIGNAGRNIITGPRLLWAQVSAQKNFKIRERFNAQFRWDFQNALKTYNFTGPGTAVDFRNPQTFGKLRDDPRTASLGGQPLMNITVAVQF
jgi:hypothetical protein